VTTAKSTTVKPTTAKPTTTKPTTTTTARKARQKRPVTFVDMSRVMGA